MSSLVLATAVAVLGGVFCAEQALAETQPTSGLSGAWVVDLSADLETPYIQPMQLELRANGALVGSFYQSEIEAGRWKTDRGRTCVSFRTTDGVGPYHTAACLVGDRVEGQTWAEHRNFQFNWNVTRQP